MLQINKSYKWILAEFSSTFFFILSQQFYLKKETPRCFWWYSDWEWPLNVARICYKTLIQCWMFSFYSIDIFSFHCVIFHFSIVERINAHPGTTQYKISKEKFRFYFNFKNKKKKCSTQLIQIAQPTVVLTGKIKSIECQLVFAIWKRLLFTISMFHE